MCSKVIEQDDLAGVKHRDDDLLDVGKEKMTVGVTREGDRNRDAIEREPHRQRDLLTGVERGGPVGADSLGSARMGARHPEVEAELVDENQVFRPIFRDFTGKVAPQGLDALGVALRRVKSFLRELSTAMQRSASHGGTR